MVSLWLKEILNDIKENVLHDKKLFVSKCNGLKYKNSKRMWPFYASSVQGDYLLYTIILRIATVRDGNVVAQPGW